MNSSSITEKSNWFLNPLRWTVGLLNKSITGKKQNVHSLLSMWIDIPDSPIPEQYMNLNSINKKKVEVEIGFLTEYESISTSKTDF